jgi:hypothetical protein
VGRRGIKEFRAPEALALIAADREHQPLVCPSCGTRTIQRVPRRRSPRPSPAPPPQGPPFPGAQGANEPAAPAERISLTCSACGRHASYLARGEEPPRDATMDPRTL